MAVVTSALINALRTGFSKEFEDAKSAAPSQWSAVATRVPSGEAFRMDRPARLQVNQGIRLFGYEQAV